MAAQGRVAAPLSVMATVTLPLLYLPGYQRLQVLGIDREALGWRPPVPGDSACYALSWAFLLFAILLTVVGTVGGVLMAIVITSFTSQPNFLVEAYMALATAVAGPLALTLSILRRARWWMAVYCFLVLGQIALGYVSVYVNDVFGPFGS